MINFFYRAACGASRRLIRATSKNPWYQVRAWDLVTGRSTGNGEYADLLAYCTAHVASSHAQLCQDLWVLWETGGKREGFFVEFGATDGREKSNTCLLEGSHAWNGILAEPFTRWHSELAANRRARIDHRCVWKESGRQLEFVATADNPEYAGLEARAFDDAAADMRKQSGERVLVQTVTLNDLLREHRAPQHIDYLSVDTEGSELDILQAFDFNRYRIDLISVEHAFNEGKRRALRELLQGHDYVQRFPRFSRWDDWYVRREFLAQRQRGVTLKRATPSGGTLAAVS